MLFAFFKESLSSLHLRLINSVIRNTFPLHLSFKVFPRQKSKIARRRGYYSVTLLESSWVGGCMRFSWSTIPDFYHSAWLTVDTQKIFIKGMNQWALYQRLEAISISVLSSFFLRIPLHSADSDCGMFQNLVMGITESTTSHYLVGQQLPSSSWVCRWAACVQRGDAHSLGNWLQICHDTHKPWTTQGKTGLNELLNIKEAPMGVWQPEQPRRHFVLVPACS